MHVLVETRKARLESVQFNPWGLRVWFLRGYRSSKTDDIPRQPQINNVIQFQAVVFLIYYFVMVIIAQILLQLMLKLKTVRKFTYLYMVVTYYWNPIGFKKRVKLTIMHHFHARNLTLLWGGGPAPSPDPIPIPSAPLALPSLWLPTFGWTPQNCSILETTLCVKLQAITWTDVGYDRNVIDYGRLAAS